MYTTRKATEADVSRIHELVNSAYRGESSKKGWTTEADIVGGQRIDAEKIRELLRHHDKAILCLVESSSQNECETVGTVCLERFEDEVGIGVYLGMLTVQPTSQNAGLGKFLMSESETFARAWGATRMILGVINVRSELMLWYQRRGYEKTGEIKPFPYGDIRFGEPKRPDLNFVMFSKSLF